MYLKRPTGCKLHNFKATDDKGGELFSIRVTDQYIIAPSSINPETGRPYKWAGGLAIDEVELAEAPEWVLDLITVHEEEAEASEYYKKRDNDFIKELKDYIHVLKSRVDFSQLLESEGIQLTEKHANYNHFDNPFGQSQGQKSFTVWTDSNVATDWHKNKGARCYDVIRFIEEFKGYGFKEAVNYLAEYSGLQRFNFGKDGAAGNGHAEKNGFDAQVVESAIENGDIIGALREIAKLEFATEKELWLKKIKDKTGVTLEALKKDLDRIKNAKEETENSQPTDPLSGYTADEIKEAEHLLKDPDILSKAIEQTARAGYVGEEVNQKTLYLSYTSRKGDTGVSN